MKDVSYNFSSIHIDAPDMLSNDIIQWGRDNVSDDDIFVSRNLPYFGREDEIHATVLYGLHDTHDKKIKELLKNEKPIDVKLGKIKIFSNPQRFDVVVIDVVSNRLHQLNKKLSENLEYTDCYGRYNPHITIAYVKKGKGWKHKGITRWSGQSFTSECLIFSSKEGFKKKLNIIS